MNVLILGLGQFAQGSGVTAALFFAKRGDDVTVTDLKSEREIASNVKRLKRFKNVRFVLGRHDLEDVRRAQLIVRNPRVRADAPEMREARRLGIKTVSDMSLFLEMCPAKVVGITGTRGKSTTTTLIYEMLRGLPLPRGAKVWIGGNILISPLSFLSKIKKNDWVVLEMSSFQLEGTGAANISPHIAVWTNLLRDHLNAYPGMDEYAEAKAQIFRHQKPGDVVFFPADRFYDDYAEEAPSLVVRFGNKNDRAERIVRSVNLKLIGEHNVRNAIIATTVAIVLGVPEAAIKKVLRTFKGLPNRLEVVAVKKGITFINDTTATTPDAVIAALRALQTRKGVIHLIFGGSDKELEFTAVAKEIKKSGARVYLLPGSAREKIMAAFKRAKVEDRHVTDLADAFRIILATAKKGDTVLLSPGATSFGQFKNEFDRGDVFRALVKRVR